LNGGGHILVKRAEAEPRLDDLSGREAMGKTSLQSHDFSFKG
jgi:hypothetical protein